MGGDAETRLAGAEGGIALVQFPDELEEAGVWQVEYYPQKLPWPFPEVRVPPRLVVRMGSH